MSNYDSDDDDDDDDGDEQSPRSGYAVADRAANRRVRLVVGAHHDKHWMMQWIWNLPELGSSVERRDMVVVGVEEEQQPA